MGDEFKPDFCREMTYIKVNESSINFGLRLIVENPLIG